MALPTYALPYKFFIIDNPSIANISVIAASKVYDTDCWSQFNNKIMYFQFLQSNINTGWFDAQYLPAEPTADDFNNLSC